MFKQYIINLIKNIHKKENPISMDLVLEGGTNNGYYEVGVLMFLKELENQGFIKVNRISGASVGSYMGFHYFNDSLNNTTKIFTTMKEHFKKELNIHIFKKLLEKDVNSMKDEVFDKIKKEKFYISTIDINKKKYIVENKYNNKEELKEAIFKSCYIPYICGNTSCYKDNYIDGIIPHIFYNRDKYNEVKILYICINQFGRLKLMFQTKEKNVDGRILEGILDAYKFFMNEKPTTICSYVNNWTKRDYILLRIKQYIILILFFLLYIITLVTKYIYPYIKSYTIIGIISIILKNIYKDTLLYCCL
jgi:hypothetical protein